ncbi:hypothetical protein ACOSQ3_004505 [Xanthoceras sorbifolium]
MDILVQRRQIFASSCPLCHRCPESLMHALWGCHLLKPVRKGCRDAKLLPAHQVVSPAEFLHSCFFQLQQDEFELLVIVLWRCWFRRNKAINNNVLLPLADFLPPSCSLQALRSPPVLWSKPLMGYYKLNIDASVSASLGVVGLGALIRDADGEVVLSGSKNLSFSTPIDMAEALAIQFGLELALDIGVRPILVEFDCLSVVNFINNRVFPLTEIGTILENIVKHSDNCQVVSFSFTPHSRNQGAQFLAQLGCSISDFSI